MRHRSAFFVLSVVAAATIGGIAAGCGSSGSGALTSANTAGEPGDDGGGGSADGADSPLGDGGSQTCPLCDQRVSCPDGGDTTLTGTVYDPSGKLPVYSAFVYVPNGSPAPIVSGASCNGPPKGVSQVSIALTDTSGRFQLRNMPVGSKIPVVFEVGKWRREITVDLQPETAACRETTVSKDLSRLPRTQFEGNIPLIALSTGAGDSLECTLRRMGIADSEFSTRGGAGRIHLYKGEDAVTDAGSSLATGAFTSAIDNGAPFPPSTSLWGSVGTLQPYDAVILSCEGAVNAESKPQTALTALYDYESRGGRVFANHQHQYWFSHGPAAVKALGTWVTAPGTVGAGQKETASINTGYVQATAFADWLQSAGGTTTHGQLDITAPRDDLSAVSTNAHAWATIPSYVDANGKSGGSAVQIMSYTVPIGQAAICGGAVFVDFHGSSATRDQIGRGAPFPSACTTGDLSPQEKAIEYMLLREIQWPGAYIANASTR